MGTITPEYRRQTTMGYTAATERIGGRLHLIHLHELAKISLSPNAGITDAPSVNFANPATMSEIHRSLTTSTPQERYRRSVQQEEAELVKRNAQNLDHLLRNEDPKFRQARHMNHFPTQEELNQYYKGEDQLFFKDKVRQRTYKSITKSNRILLSHLHGVKSHLPSASALHRWHSTVHQKRLRQLSKFKRSEAFAGERVLREVIPDKDLPLGKRFPGKGGLPVAACEDTAQADRPINRWRRAKQQPSYAAFAHASAAAGKPVYPTKEDEAAVTAAAHRRREWQRSTPSDVLLLNFISDSAILRPTRCVSRGEENPVTRHWRHEFASSARVPPKSGGKLGQRLLSPSHGLGHGVRGTPIGRDDSARSGRQSPPLGSLQPRPPPPRGRPAYSERKDARSSSYGPPTSCTHMTAPPNGQQRSEVYSSSVPPMQKTRTLPSGPQQVGEPVPADQRPPSRPLMEVLPARLSLSSSSSGHSNAVDIPSATPNRTAPATASSTGKGNVQQLAGSFPRPAATEEGEGARAESNEA